MKRATFWLTLPAVALAGFVSTADADLPFFRRDRDDRSESRERASRSRQVREARYTLVRSPRGTAAPEVLLVQNPPLIPPAPLREPGLPPIPDAFSEPAPLPGGPSPLQVIPEQMPLIPEMVGPYASGPIEIYQRVEYDDRDDAHPRGVKQLVAVRDPRACRKACDCCGARLVLVEVCVPPHGCPKVKVGNDAREVKLDYGEYEIEIEVDDDKIEVEYED